MLNLSSTVATLLDKSNILSVPDAEVDTDTDPSTDLDTGIGADNVDHTNITPTRLLIISPAHLLRNNVFDKLSALIRLLCSSSLERRHGHGDHHYQEEETLEEIQSRNPWRNYRLTVLTDSVETFRVSFAAVLGHNRCNDADGNSLVELVELQKEVAIEIEAGSVASGAEKEEPSAMLRSQDNANNTAATSGKGAKTATRGMSVLSYDQGLLKFQKSVLASHTTVELEDSMRGWYQDASLMTGEEVNSSKEAVEVAAATRSVQAFCSFFRQFNVLLYRDIGWDLRFYSTITLNNGLTSPINKLHSEIGVFSIAVHLAWLTGTKTVRYLDMSTSTRAELGYFYSADGYILESTTQLVQESPVRLMLGPLRSAKPLIVLSPLLPAAISSSMTSGSNIWRRRQENVAFQTAGGYGRARAGAGAGVFRVLFAGGFRSYACPGAFIRMVASVQRLVRQHEQEMQYAAAESAVPSATFCHLFRLVSGFSATNETFHNVNDGCPASSLKRFTGLAIVRVSDTSNNYSSEDDLDDVGMRKDGSDTDSSSNVFTLHFTMFGDGHLHAAMLSLITSLGVQDIIHIVIPPDEKEVNDDFPDARDSDSHSEVSVHDHMLASLFAQTDLLVEPCTTYAGSGFVLPLAMMHRVPVALFSSCASREWLVDSSAVVVNTVSIQAMAQKILSVALFSVTIISRRPITPIEGSETKSFSTSLPEIEFSDLTPIRVTDLDAVSVLAQKLFSLEALGRQYLQLFNELQRSKQYRRESESLAYSHDDKKNDLTTSDSGRDGNHDCIRDVSLPLETLMSEPIAVEETPAHPQWRQPRRYYPAGLARLPLSTTSISPSQQHMSTNTSVEYSDVATAKNDVNATWLTHQAGKYNRIWQRRCAHGKPFGLSNSDNNGGLSDAGVARLCSDASQFESESEHETGLSRVETLIVDHISVVSSSSYTSINNPPTDSLNDVDLPVDESKNSSLSSTTLSQTQTSIRTQLRAQIQRRRPRLFCAVFTTTEENNLSSPHRDLARTQLLTWGKRCDGFVAFSNTTDWLWNTVQVTLPGHRTEHYHNMWQKVRAIWTFIYDNFAQPLPQEKSETQGQDGEFFDWFIIGGDDLYIVVENLRELIKEAEAEVNIEEGEIGYFLGRPLRTSKQLLYNTGGAGYLLNVHTLRRLVPYLRPVDIERTSDTASNGNSTIQGSQISRSDSVSEMCFPHENKSVEDVFMGYCLAELGIFTANTADSSGRERFHWQSPETEFYAQDRYYMHQTSRENFGLPVKSGLKCCSHRSVTFQNLKPADFHAYLYK